MNVVGYAGWVGFSLLIAFGIRWLDPTVLSSLSRQTGFTARKAWLLATVAFLWMWLPILAGAETGEGRLWVFGVSISGVGFFLAAISTSSIDEYRLLRRVPHHEPGDVPVGVDEPPIATSGKPRPLEDHEGEQRSLETPFSGTPAVHTDWIVQERKRVGFRETWQNAAGGVRTTTFALGGGAVEVTPGRSRVFSNAENRFVIEPEEEVPEPAATFLEDRTDLPAPRDRENPLRFVETYVPLDGPVTVVGTVEQTREPGVVRIDDGPVDELLGTHADHAAAEGGADVVLIQGAADDAERSMEKLVVWLGAAAVAMILGGQILAFWLSSATPAALVG